MHLLIPFAFCSSEGCASVLPTLKLPNLEKLLARLTPELPDTGDEFSLSAPHERALARALGLPVEDGLIPWAASQAGSAESAWAFITPCHWQIGTNHIAMSGQALPDFSAQESQTLLAAMQPYFEEDGITLQYEQPTRWLARAEVFRELATASLDRVVGRNLENWMPRSASAANLRRLQNEMQMLLYTHPVNDARSARGVLPVNSFWLSGTGALPASPRTPAMAPAPVPVSTLRDAALNEDWAAWAHAWHALDANECAALLAALDHKPKAEDETSQPSGITLTLCGERNAQTFNAQPQPYLKRFMNIFGTQRPSTLLEKL
jgi:hypothetical protein